MKRPLPQRIWLTALPLLLLAPTWAQAPAMPDVSLRVGGAGGQPDLAASLQVVVLLTILSLAPAIIMLLTSFPRIVIVLGFMRTALGTQQIPPNSVLVGLALFLTAFTWAPVWERVNTEALQPYLSKKVSYDVAFTRAMLPVRDFMFRQTRERDLALFVELSHMPRPRTRADVQTHVLVPAFLISEMKTAFTMGFLLFIPFVVIDLVVASILMSMGMMMMPPVLVSMPCKIMLFVLVDGWAMLAQTLVQSFH